jgi:hypothetical protein
MPLSTQPLRRRITADEAGSGVIYTMEQSMVPTFITLNGLVHYEGFGYKLLREQGFVVGLALLPADPDKPESVKGHLSEGDTVGFHYT